MERRGLRGQTGLELIIGISVLLMIFCVIVLIAMEKTAESSRIKTLLDARRVATSVKDNVNMIGQQGPGYYSYFSLPNRLHGDYEYDIVIRGNVLEMMWGERTWTTRVMDSNISVHCLSKGLNTRNRIKNNKAGIEVTCHLPNLKVVPGSLVIVDNTTWVEIVNDAHVDSPYFKTSLLTNDTTLNVSTSSLKAYDSLTLSFNSTFGEFVTVTVDYLDTVNESIETDNNVTKTI
ncbi:MAG: hypothetical protein GF416_06855 [Candidatus Altiarchaeales archaeon]|nr:hypothetical protein [Candidatus Altiarchaeales archaeon]MBD3416832.1 hypothetical protein [Candidatus Altiarchaeales archaeon]